MSLILRKEEIASLYGHKDWQHIVYKELEATFTSKSRDFPCGYGVNGFNKSELRFAFCDPLSGENLAQALGQYLPDARTFGKHTSLVVFSRPGPVLEIESYRQMFWNILRETSELDPEPWPDHVPDQIDHADWEWCFRGEQIFVVCNTPAHVNRQSRRSSSLTLTFQPRWVFEGLLDTHEMAYRATRGVRKRLDKYDVVATSPDLGLYGDPDNREYAQYFLDDVNGPRKCPFHQIRQDIKEKVA